MTRKVIVILVAVAGVIAVVWLAKSLWLGPSSGGAASGGSAPRQAVDEARYALSVDATNPASESSVALELGSRAGREGSQPSLGEAVGDTFEAYLSGQAAAFLEYFEKYHITPPSILETDPEYFERGTVLFRGARFDVENITVSRRFSDGEPTSGAGASIARRDEGRPFLDQMRQSDRQRMEVAVPRMYSGLDGTIFEGVLRLRYTYNPQRSQWVLTASRIEGIPNGVPASSPPL